MKITDFDPADYLTTKEAMIEYLNEALKTSIEDNTPEHFMEALGNVTRAQGIANAAKATDLNREHLYRSLSKKGNPTFSTIIKLIKFLGLEINITEAQSLRNNFSGWRDLNPRSSGPKPDALAPRLHPDASEHNTQNGNECQDLGAKVFII